MTRLAPRPLPRGLGVDVRGALNLVGRLVAFLGPAYLVPAAVAVGYDEPVWPFLAAGLVTSGSGLALERVTDGRERVGVREGYLVVALLWLVIAVLGALPYLLAEPQLDSAVDAVFESMAGFSTAGASVLSDVEALSRSMALWRQLTAWLGGLGVIVLVLAVLPGLRVGGRQALFTTESTGPELGLSDTIRATSRRFLVLYVGLTLAEAVVLAGLGWAGIDEHMTPFRAVAHSLATVATAGFSTEVRSLEPFAPATHWVVVVFMLVAGTNFALLYVGLVRRRPRAFTRDEELRVYLLVAAVVSALVLVELAAQGLYSGEPLVRHAVFNSVSMLTTTGFASTDFSRWTSVTALLLWGVTLLGASAGSTSGSIKLVRHVIIFKMLRREIDHTVHPSLVAPLRLNGRSVDERTLRAVIVFVFLYLGVWAAGAVLISIDSSLRGVELTTLEALADAAATLGGAGIGLGFAGPVGSYEPFSDVSTLVLTALMYLGRLEIIPVLVLFTRDHWRA